MADERPQPPSRAATTSSRSPDPPPSAAVRHRIPQRQSSSPSLSASPRPTLNRRRSSILSYSSIEDITQALTDDIINPSTSRARDPREYDEVTNWHSTPLAFALLPAIGGLLFKNGSAFVTDILLIVLAAIFMNWSIRLPWDWYFSAQARRRFVEPDYDQQIPEVESDDLAVESASSAGNSPKPLGRVSESPERETISPQIERREEAAAELRRQETLALLATILFPVLAAWLLHLIRAQLSPSSTGLVSDYNLTIFLLAAEIRPCRQLIRLVTSRTLHLQRTVNGINDPFATSVEDKSTIATLTTRIADLEAKLEEYVVVPRDTPIAQKTDVSDLSTELRKRYEPRLEGLERAVRRYEKRSTTLTMLTDQRLGSLETRLQDALSLAAVAAQQSQQRGAFTSLIDGVAAVLLWPGRLAYSLATSPLHALEEIYLKCKTVLLGPGPSRGVKRSSSRPRGVKDGALKEKRSTSKLVR